MKYVKAQAFVAVLLILALVGIFAGALGTMWEGELKSRTLERDGAQALYLVQAGIERGKIWVGNNYTSTGCFPTPCTTPRTWFSLDAANRQQYRFEISDLGSYKRLIQSWGRVLDENNNELASKAARVELEGIGSGKKAKDPPEDRSNDAVISGTWREF